MSFKYYPIPDAIFFSASGPHATRYLHNRLSNNIKDLKVGAHCRAAALNPQGRAEAFVTVLREDDQKYLLYSDGWTPSGVSAELLRYRVADRIELEHIPDLKLWHVVGGFNNSGFLGADNCVCLPSGRSLHGQDVIGKDFVPPPNASELNFSEAAAIRIRAKWPIFPDEIGNDVMLLELGLSDAVSFNKGCYVGQEVLERVDSHGRPPRFLYVGELSHEHTEWDIKDSSGRIVGELLTVAKDGSSWVAFTLIKSSVSPKIGDLFTVGKSTLKIIG